MLADSAQTFAVVLIVAAAAGYLVVIARRSWKSGHGGACSGCHTVAAVRDAAEVTEGSKPAMFIPIENVEDAARRHREQTLAAEPPPPPESRS